MEMGIGAAIAAIATALGAYFIGRRNTSGSIETSSAAELWERVVAHLDVVKAENGELRTELAVERRLREALADKVAKLEFESIQKDELIRHLRTENTSLALRVNELENRLERAGRDFAGHTEEAVE